MPDKQEPEVEKLIGEAQAPGQKMSAHQAVAILCEGFHKVMEFMHQEVGVKRGDMEVAMKMAQHYGLTFAEPGMTPKGVPFVHYRNPFKEHLPQNVAPPARKSSIITGQEGNA